MKKNNSWESLVSIVIAVSIMMVLFVSLYKILEYDKNLDYNYTLQNYKTTLENNTQTLLRKIDTTSLIESQVFYILQTPTNISIESDEKYKFTNHLWEWNENINSQRYLFTRVCVVKKSNAVWQNIQCSITPLVRK